MMKPEVETGEIFYIFNYSINCCTNKQGELAKEAHSFRSPDGYLVFAGEGGLLRILGEGYFLTL